MVFVLHYSAFLHYTHSLSSPHYRQNTSEFSRPWCKTYPWMVGESIISTKQLVNLVSLSAHTALGGKKKKPQQLSNCLLRVPPVFQKPTPPSLRLVYPSYKVSTDWWTGNNYEHLANPAPRSEICGKRGRQWSRNKS